MPFPETLRSIYPLDRQPGDRFVWGAWVCTHCYKVLWVTPLTGVERRTSLCLRCQKRERYLPKPFWYIGCAADLPRVGESSVEWEERRRREAAVKNRLRAAEQRGIALVGASIITEEMLSRMLDEALK